MSSYESSRVGHKSGGCFSGSYKDTLRGAASNVCDSNTFLGVVVGAELLVMAGNC